MAPSDLREGMWLKHKQVPSGYYIEVLNCDGFSTHCCVKVQYIGHPKRSFVVEQMGETRWVAKSILTKNFTATTKNAALAQIILFGEADDRS